MFLFIFSVFVFVILLSWFFFHKELHFGKLNSIPYDSNINIFHFMSPFLLMYLTSKKVPVSSTLLFATSFSSASILHTILTKTIQIDRFSFLIGFILWKYIYFLLIKKFEKYDWWTRFFEANNDTFWLIMQYVSTALLWLSWLFSNLSSVLIFIPREFDVKSLIILFIFAALIIFYLIDNMGGEMQQLIKNKKNTNNVKSATMINIVYGVLIYIFQLNFRNIQYLNFL